MPIYTLDGIAPEIHRDCWVAPNATLIGKVRLCKGASVWFGAILRGDNDWITVNENSNIQDLTLLHTDPGHPVIVGRGVTVGHRVIIHGAMIEDNCLVGMGSTLLNGAHIARDSLVGAGALVTENKKFGIGQMVMGIPAKVARALTQEEITRIGRSAEIYVANARRYAALPPH